MHKEIKWARRISDRSYHRGLILTVEMNIRELFNRSTKRRCRGVTDAKPLFEEISALSVSVCAIATLPTRTVTDATLQSLVASLMTSVKSLAALESGLFDA